MESIEIERLSGEPIIIARFGADFDVATGFSKSRKVIGKAFRGQSGGPFYYILNISALEFSFSELVRQLAELTDPRRGPYRNPLLKEIIFVTTSALGKVMSDAIQQEQYGAKKSKLFSSEEEAIAYARSQAAMQS